MQQADPGWLAHAYRSRCELGIRRVPWAVNENNPQPTSHGGSALRRVSCLNRSHSTAITLSVFCAINREPFLCTNVVVERAFGGPALAFVSLGTETKP